MQKIKKISILSILLMGFGCAFDSDKNEEVATEPIARGQDIRPDPRVVDSDGDGIPDVVDPSPNIAILPRIGIHRVDQLNMGVLAERDNEDDLFVSIENTRGSSSNAMTSVRERWLRSKIINLHREKARNPLFTPNNEETIKIEDFYTTPISMWTVGDEKNFLEMIEGRRLKSEGSLVIDFNAVLHNLAHIEQISDIKYEILSSDRTNLTGAHGIITDMNGSASIFNLRPGEPDLFLEQNTRLLNRRFDSRTVKEIVEKGSRLKVRISDFNYQTHGMRLNFRDQISKIKSSSSLFIISSQNGIEYKFVRSGTNLLDGFKNLTSEIIAADNGGILSVYGNRNALPVPLDVDGIDPTDFGSISVQLIGANSLMANSRPGQTYIISVARGSDLVRNRRVNAVKEVSTNEGEIDLGGFIPGERAVVSIRAQIHEPEYVVRQKDVRIVYMSINADCAARMCGGGNRGISRDCYDSGIADRCGEMTTINTKTQVGTIENRITPQRFNSRNIPYDPVVTIGGDLYRLSDISTQGKFETSRNGDHIFAEIEVPNFYEDKVSVKLRTIPARSREVTLGLIDHPCQRTGNLPCSVTALDGSDTNQRQVTITEKIATQSSISFKPN